jgi:hypothetical protein
MQFNRATKQALDERLRISTPLIRFCSITRCGFPVASADRYYRFVAAVSNRVAAATRRAECPCRD